MRRPGGQDTALTTARERRQRVQTRSRRLVRPTSTRTLWTFGYQTRELTLCA